jgi:hypothetical protein
VYNVLYRQVFWIQGVWAIIACSLVMWVQVLFMQEVAKRDSGSSLILVIGAFFFLGIAFILYSVQFIINPEFYVFKLMLEMGG